MSSQSTGTLVNGQQDASVSLATAAVGSGSATPCFGEAHRAYKAEPAPVQMDTTLELGFCKLIMLKISVLAQPPALSRARSACANSWTQTRPCPSTWH